MRKLYPAALLLGALAACATEPSAPAAPEIFSASADANGVSNPNTAVSAVVKVSVEGTIVYRTSGPGNNGKGECYSEGRWYNPQNKKTSDKPHPQCATVTPGMDITVTFANVANYVLPNNGNVNLNFNPVAGCDPLTDAFGCTRSLQFKKNQDVTVGSGLLTTTETEHGTGVWTIDLANPILNASGNLIIPTGTTVIACNATLGCHPGVMTW